MPSVEILIIGDEILSGKFADENGPYAIRRLRELGADLRRITTLPDGVDVIGEAVAAAVGRADVVLTSGGVGPTHDDTTWAGVAAGLGVPLEERAELVALIRQYGLPVTEASLRMARVPVGTELVWDPTRIDLPAMRAGKVWVFPGIPRLFRRKFDSVAHRFSGAPVRVARLVTAADEVEFAVALGEVADRWPAVSFGSYPRSEGGEHVIVTLEARDADALAAAWDALLAVMPAVTATEPPAR